MNVCQSEVALPCKRIERSLEDAYIGKTARDRYRVVAAEAIHHEDGARPAKSVQCPLDIGRFVVREDQYSDLIQDRPEIRQRLKRDCGRRVSSFQQEHPMQILFASIRGLEHPYREVAWNGCVALLRRGLPGRCPPRVHIRLLQRGSRVYRGLQ